MSGGRTCAILTVLLGWVPTCWTSSKPEHKSVCFETFRSPIEFARPVDRIAQAEFDRLVVYADSRSRSANHIVSTSGRSQHFGFGTCHYQRSPKHRFTEAVIRGHMNQCIASRLASTRHGLSNCGLAKDLITMEQNECVRGFSYFDLLLLPSKANAAVQAHQPDIDLLTCRHP